MKVKEAMHTGVTWVSPTTALPKVAKKMRDEDVGAIPVGENDRLIGMVTDRDIVCRGVVDGKDLKSLTAADVMTKGIVYCRADDDIDNAIESMKKNKIRRLTVLDGNKRMVGMLSLGDVACAASKSQCTEVMQAVSAHHA
jgi:CBS domain-containing protein